MQGVTIGATDEYLAWFRELEEQAQEHTRAIVRLLKEKGPGLGRPYVDSIKGSQISNLKELRVQAAGRKFRIFFVFLKDRSGLLLIGGVKGGPKDKSFYDRMIPIAESLYAAYVT